MYEIALNVNSSSLGYLTCQLKEFDILDLSKKSSSYYLRILAKDISGVLAKITSNLNEEGISIETILQIPDNKTQNNQVPIIIVTHETAKNFLTKALIKIEKLDFVFGKVSVITIDKNFD